MRAQIVWTKHAESKFAVLRSLGFTFTKPQIIDVVRNSDTMIPQKDGTEICQKPLDEEYVVRVVVAREGTEVRIITFYPGRRERYANPV